MKKQYIILLLLFTSLMLGCKGEEDISSLEITRAEMLTFMEGSWTVQEVRKDNVAITDFNNFTINFSEMSYQTENGAPVWQTNGEYNFASEQAENLFTRADGISFEVIRNAGNMQLNISYSEPANRQGIEGNYQFFLVQN